MLHKIRHQNTLHKNFPFSSPSLSKILVALLLSYEQSCDHTQWNHCKHCKRACLFHCIGQTALKRCKVIVIVRAVIVFLAVMQCFQWFYCVWSRLHALCYLTTPTQSGSVCKYLLSDWVTTTGRLLGRRLQRRATTSEVEPRFRNLSITSPALCQLMPRLHMQVWQLGTERKTWRSANLCRVYTCRFDN